MRRSFYSVVIAAAWLLVVFSSASAQERTPGVRSFVHPDKLFSLPLPAGVVRGRPERYRGGAPDLVVRSDDGFVLSVEARPLKMAGSERAVLDQLERLYLGPGKPWSRRLTSRSIRVGGLPGVRATYAGPETGAAVAVARGRNTDFLLMFFTPVGLQDRLLAQFNWMLERFDVAATERRDSGSPLVRAPVHKAPGVFHHEKLGYTVRYPETWRAAYVPPFGAVFAPARASDVRVRIENIVPPPSAMAADTVLKQWRSGLTAAADSAHFTRVRPLIGQTPGGTRVGMTVVAEYLYHGRKHRQWAAVLPRDDGKTVHLWRYDAPADRFDSYREAADGILRSMVLDHSPGG